MTEEQIRAASGRKLDALVGEQVMGWTLGTWSEYWKPSEQIARCFDDVIPAMREKGYWFRGDDCFDGFSTAFCKYISSYGNEGAKCPSNTVVVPFGEEATGICRASLLALLAEENVQA